LKTVLLFAQPSAQPSDRRNVTVTIIHERIAFFHPVIVPSVTRIFHQDFFNRAAYVKGKPKVQAYMEEHRASARCARVATRPFLTDRR
jgi:hypothetical protein